MIEEVSPQELSLTRDCAYGFFEESKLPGQMNLPHWQAQWGAIISKGIGVIFACIRDGKAVGVIGGVCVQCTMTAQFEAIEAFWYILPEYRKGTLGIRLLQHFEVWGKARGAARVKMMHLSDLNADTMREIYLRLGYQPLEQAYTKEI